MNKPVIVVPERSIPLPQGLSDRAAQFLLAAHPDYPQPEDGNAEAWRELVERRNADAYKMLSGLANKLEADVERDDLNGAIAYRATPRADRLIDAGHVVLDLHGGGFLYFGGEAHVRFAAKAMAIRSGRTTYSVDYRVPPDHPFPAALDDCIAAYRALLGRYGPGRIVVEGLSAGGNLAAALLLRARQEGLPMPAALILLSPHLDLTLGGDSFAVLAGLDPVLQEPVAPLNRLYAGDAPLSSPLLSPLFGEVDGFPRSFIQAGGRDRFLSNAIRFHRKLRAANVPAELHVWEGMPHGGFGGGTSEDRDMTNEIRRFLGAL